MRDYQELKARVNTLREPSESAAETAKKTLDGNHGEQGHEVFKYQLPLAEEITHSIEYHWFYCETCKSIIRKEFVGFWNNPAQAYVRELLIKTREGSYR